MSAIHEYDGLVADTWDLFRGDTSTWPDRTRYLECIRAYGEPVLDVGCAGGRLLLDYLAQGIDIDGVDIAPDMLAVLRAKAERAGLAPTLYRQSLTALELPRRYQTILVSSSTIQLVVDRADAAEAMRRLRAHLLPGGALVMAFMDLAPSYRDALEVRSTDEATGPDDAIYRRQTHSWYEPDNGLEHSEYRIEKRVGGEVVATVTRRMSGGVRSYTQAEARALFEGLELAEVLAWSGFTREPMKPEDALFVLVGLAPQD